MTLAGMRSSLFYFPSIVPKMFKQFLVLIYRRANDICHERRYLCRGQRPHEHFPLRSVQEHAGATLFDATHPLISKPRTLRFRNPCVVVSSNTERKGITPILKLLLWHRSSMITKIDVIDDQALLSCCCFFSTL